LLFRDESNASRHLAVAVAQGLQREGSHGLTFLKFPTFKATDCDSCRGYSTHSGSFPGRFNDETWTQTQDILKFSELCQSYNSPQWLISPDANDCDIKEVLRFRLREGLTLQKFLMEFRSAFNEQRRLWENGHCLSVLFILLRGRAIQEEQITYISKSSWKSRWTSILLSVPAAKLRRKPFGYRVALLLGCELVNDP
jgi:hypothetical protein